MPRKVLRTAVVTLALAVLPLPMHGQSRRVRIVLDLNSTDVSVIARQQAYLERYQEEYSTQLAAVKEACPLVYAHLRLLELADLNLLTDPAVRQSLTEALGEPRYRTPYFYAQTLSKSENSLLVLRNFRTAGAARNCGSPSRFIRANVNLQGTLSEERGMDEALKMWADCVYGR